MTPIRETIARAIFETYTQSDIRADWADGVTWEQFLSWSARTVSDMPRAAVDAYAKTIRDEADAVLRALDKAGMVVVKRESPAAVEAITGDAWGAVYELGRTSERIGGGAAHITEDEARRMVRAVIDAVVVE